ncbi:MAG: hypothetical protein K0Q95_332 [Bacteroidota bacterium]|jgi:hypothetical protein|nr:hypothetical protein [Bacteroidota bacterium]
MHDQDYFEKTSDLIKNYTEDRILLLKIQAAKKTGQLSSKLIFFIVLILLVFFLLFFVSMMGGYYFADLTGSLYKGFSIIAGLYLLLLFSFLILYRKYISIKIMDMTTRIFFENESRENEE